MHSPRAPEGVTIRPAATEDAARVAELSAQLGYATTAAAVAGRIETIRRLVGHDLSVAVLADGTVTGWIHCYVRHIVMVDPMLEIDGLVVDERHRGRGIGRLLMGHAEDLGRETGCRVMNLRSNVARSEAHAFYRRIGYDLAKRQGVFRRELF